MRMMRKRRGMLAIFACLWWSINTHAQQQIKVEVFPKTSRAIQGKLNLERSKYFNLSASGTNIEGTIGDQERIDYYFKDLKMTIGRALGMVGSEVTWGNSVFEDPARPGYTDIPRLVNKLNPSNSGASTAFMDLLGENQNVAFHDRHNSYPTFMDQYTMEGSTQSYPVNNDAAAELATTLLEHKFTDWTRPAFYEPVNEPDWRFWSDLRFIEHHTSIHEKVKAANLPVEVGGPCLSVGYFYKNKFDALSQITGFIDKTQASLDFYSYHIYDYMHWDDEAFDFIGSVTSGLPTEGVFDAISNYTMNKFGEQFTYVASEHGGYISDANNREYALNKLAGIYFPGSGFSHTMEKRSIADFLAVSSELANTFTYMNHPHVVKKAVPFILLESFGWDPEYYASLLVADKFTDNGNWVESKRIHFYEFFRDVQGRRILSFCDDADIQHHAFVDEDKLMLLFHNQSNVEGNIDIQINGNMGGVKEIMARKFGRKPDFRPYLTEERISTLEDGLEIKAREAILLTIRYDGPINEEKILDEIPHYGNSTGVQFSGSQNFQVAMPDFQEAEYAILRVGIGLGATNSKNVSISINGTPLDSPVEDCADRLSGGGDYGTTRMMRVDTSLLQADNTITVNFVDGQTGGVGATVIRAGYASTDTIAALDITKQSITLYENQTTSLEVTFLPETTNEKQLSWESLDPGIASVSENGVIKGETEGATSIVAHSAFGAFSDTCSVTVIAQNLVSTSDKTGWIAVYADDEGFINGTLKELAIDNNPGTYWHTEWLLEPWKPMPHEIWVDMGDTLTFDRFIYTPRQDQWGPNGNIGDYELYFSNDSADWGTPEASGSFIWNIGEENYYKEIQQIDLAAPVTARFFRLVALTEHQGNPAMTHTNAAELDVASDITGLALEFDTLRISVGESTTLKVQSLPFSGTIPGDQVNWIAENLLVAGVTDGKVTGEGPGVTKIIANTFDGAYSDTCTIEVSIIPVEKISISSNTLNLNKGDLVILEAEVIPVNAYYNSFRWISDDDGVATVEMGYISAQKAGKANIIAISTDGVHRDSCSVTVTDNKYNVQISLIDDYSGLPLEGASVTLQNNSVVTNANGVALFTEVQMGNFNLSVTKEKYQSFTGSVSIPADTLYAVRVFRSKHQLEIEVSELVTGTPVSNADIQVGNTLGRTNSEGKISLSLDWGDYNYTLSKSYFEPSSGLLTISGDTLITIQLIRHSADLKFRAIDSTGILQGATIHLDGASGVTNGVGVYTFTALDANVEYGYEVEKPGYDPVSGFVLLRQDTTVSVWLTLGTSVDLVMKPALRIYPNPVNNQLQVISTMGAQMQILSLDGVILKDEMLEPGKATISMQELEPGLYLLRHISETGTEILPISVIH